MVTKRVRQKETTEDFLGLVTFGSLIANIFQIASKNRLEDQHNKLKADAFNLKKHYDGMIERYKQLSREYSSLKNYNAVLSEVNTGLRQENNRLVKKLDTLKEENLKLKGSQPIGAFRKKRITKEK